MVEVLLVMATTTPRFVATSKQDPNRRKKYQFAQRTNNGEKNVNSMKINNIRITKIKCAHINRHTRTQQKNGKKNHENMLFDKNRYGEHEQRKKKGKMYVN